MIAETTQRYVDEEVNPRIEEIENQELQVTKDLLKKSGNLGLLSMEVSEEYGGLGLDKASAVIVIETLAPVGSFAISYGSNCGIGTLPIVYFGTEDQKQKYLPKLASGEIFSAYALTEASAGSDALSAKSTAVLSSDGKHWIINGEKMWITNAGFADLFIVFARIDGQDLSAFIVERNFPGVKVGPEEKKLGIKGSSTCTVLFEDAQIPVDNLLGKQGQGHKIALNILNMGRFKLGAHCVGVAKEAVNDSIHYSSERQQFGKVIAEFGAIQEKLAEMAIRTWIAQSMLYRTVGMIDENLQRVQVEDTNQILKGIGEYAVECSIIKVWGTEMLDFVVDEAVQIHGGNGYSQEYSVERYYRDSRINRIFEGTNEINRLLIIGMLLRRDTKGEVALIKASYRILAELNLFPEPTESFESLSEERQIVNNAKNATLMLVGLAVQKYGDQLTEEQEIVISLADMIMEVYGMESGLLRVLKILKSDPEGAELHSSLIRCHIHDAIEKIQISGKKVLTVISERDEQHTYLVALRRFCKHSLVPAIQLRREIAGELLKAKKYKL